MADKQPAPVPDELVRAFLDGYVSLDPERSILIEHPRVRAGLAAVVARLTGPGDTGRDDPIRAKLRKVLDDYIHYGDPQGGDGRLGARAKFARELLALDNAAGVVGVPAQPANDEAKPDYGTDDDEFPDWSGSFPSRSGTAQDTPEDR